MDIFDYSFFVKTMTWRRCSRALPLFLALLPPTYTFTLNAEAGLTDAQNMPADELVEKKRMAGAKVAIDRGGAMTAPDDKTFKVWDDGANDHDGGETSTMPGGNVIMTAQWLDAGAPTDSAIDETTQKTVEDKPALSPLFWGGLTLVENTMLSDLSADGDVKKCLSLREAIASYPIGNNCTSEFYGNFRLPIPGLNSVNAHGQASANTTEVGSDEYFDNGEKTSKTKLDGLWLSKIFHNGKTQIWAGKRPYKTKASGNYRYLERGDSDDSLGLGLENIDLRFANLDLAIFRVSNEEDYNRNIGISDDRSAVIFDVALEELYVTETSFFNFYADYRKVRETLANKDVIPLIDNGYSATAEYVIKTRTFYTTIVAQYASGAAIYLSDYSFFYNEGSSRALFWSTWSEPLTNYELTTNIAIKEISVDSKGTTDAISYSANLLRRWNTRLSTEIGLGYDQISKTDQGKKTLKKITIVPLSYSNKTMVVYPYLTQGYWNEAANIEDFNNASQLDATVIGVEFRLKFSMMP